MTQKKVIYTALNLCGFTKKELDDILELIDFDSITNSDISIISRKNFKSKIFEAEKLVNDKSYDIITIEDDEYPKQLLDLKDAPIVLYIKGSLSKSDFKSVAVVGTRKPTNYGYQVVRKLVEFLSEYGITIVSGFARGIDILAHKTAIENKNRTIAVLGSGLNKIYPPEHKKYIDKLIENGAIITEYPPNIPAFKENFPRRNRIIAALTQVTIVVEAKEVAGALITAKIAAEIGREVFSVPGSIFEPNSKGTNMLIKNGARILDEFESIIDTIADFRKLERKIKAVQEVDESYKKILDMLEVERSFDELLSTGILAQELMEKLLELELKGAIRKLPGNRYIKSI
ncbi:MAG: DNA-processing protein DprA [bacterium]|nr:DNA-processing protein DprA [bacterium]